MTLSVEQMSEAIVRRVGALFGVPIDPATVDVHEPFLSADGFKVGPEQFDSINLVEMMVVLEDELGVELLDAADVLEIDTVAKLAERVLETAPPDKVRAFCGVTA